MKRYMDLKIEREHSKYPRGLKHFSKDRIFENCLFDLDIIWYKVRSIWKGGEDGKRNKTWCEEEGARTPKEILRGLVLRVLYEDWDSEDRDGENRGVEERYISLNERESEERQEGGE